MRYKLSTALLFVGDDTIWVHVIGPTGTIMLRAESSDADERDPVESVHHVGRWMWANYFRALKKQRRRHERRKRKQ